MSESDEIWNHFVGEQFNWFNKLQKHTLIQPVSANKLISISIISVCIHSVPKLCIGMSITVMSMYIGTYTEQVPLTVIDGYKKTPNRKKQKRSIYWWSHQKMYRWVVIVWLLYSVSQRQKISDFIAKVKPKTSISTQYQFILRNRKWSWCEWLKITHPNTRTRHKIN